jgi:pyruvate dehydrogenase E1 component
LRRMYQEQEDCFYYITVMNENYQQPDMPKGAEAGIRKGLYLFSKAASGKSKAKAQLMGCGTILREVIAAAEMLKQDFDVACDIWSATSFNELAREADDIHRSNRLNPGRKPKLSHVEKCLNGQPGPVIAASDYMRAFANQIREYVPQSFTTLGTDGFGRSDTRAKLREFFEVDRNYIAYTTIHTLAQEGDLPAKAVTDAMKKYGIDPKKPNPAKV